MTTNSKQLNVVGLVNKSQIVKVNNILFSCTAIIFEIFILRLLFDFSAGGLSNFNMKL